MVAALLITNQTWLWPAAGVLAAVIVLLIWNYRRAPADRGWRLACALLKLTGMAALLACLLEPLWTTQRARPGANHFIVVADNSEGLRIKDRGAATTRAHWLTNRLADAQRSWMASLEREFQVRRYTFDTQLQSTRDFSELTFDGRASALGTALRTLAERFRGQPLAGILVFTDGNATDLPDGPPSTEGWPPVYPVVVGRDDPMQDLALQKVTVSQTAFEDAPVTVQADVAAIGYGGRPLTAQLLDPAGRVVQELSQTAARERAAFRFQLRAEQPGLAFYRLRVAARDELGQFESPPSSPEATLANNGRVVVVDRGQGPYRILYVAGRPNWEFKFLNRALAEDSQVELAPLIRVARREPKFEFRGRLGETSNPLFRGFDRQDEDTERYDQPVLKCPNPKYALELADGFPKTPEALYRFHAVILDDLEADFFTRDQMALLHKFVTERGGGFLMLGGAESFRQGRYDRTPVGDLLPVYLDAPRDPAPGENLRLSFTKEGWLQPWVRLRDTEAAEHQRLDTMPPLQVLNTVRGLKPGATVLLEARDQNNRLHPALVEQRFGRGRAGALLVGDWWRWGLRDEQNRRDLDKAWRQLGRWLISDVPERLEVHLAAQRGDPNQAMTIQVRARDPQFRPLDNATVAVTVTPLEGLPSTNRVDPHVGGPGSVRLPAEASATEPGLYSATYVPRTPGGYLAGIVVTDAQGGEVGRTQAGWAADPAAEEFRSLKPNAALLETLARQTGGEVVRSDDLAAFVASLPNRKAPITESWSFPLWHQPAVLLLVLACFAAEWGLRRWKGLA